MDMTEICSVCGSVMNPKMSDGTTTDGPITYECPDCGYQLVVLPTTIIDGKAYELGDNQMPDIQDLQERLEEFLEATSKIEGGLLDLESELQSTLMQKSFPLDAQDMARLNRIAVWIEDLVKKCQSQR